MTAGAYGEADVLVAGVYAEVVAGVYAEVP